MKKLLSILLVLCMLSSMTVCAFATENEGTEEVVPPVVAIPVVEPEVPAEDPGTPEEDIEPQADVVLDGQEIACDTLQEAVTAAGENGTVSVNKSAESVDIGGAVVKESVTIELNGNDVTINNPTVGSTGTTTIGMQLLKESEEVTIKGEGGSIIFDGASSADEMGKTKFTTESNEDSGNPWLKRGIQNYTDLTLDNVTIDGSDLADNYGAAADGALDFNANYENTVISNCNGGLVVDNQADVLAAKGDNAIAVHAYTDGNYTDGPTVVIGSNAGVIDGAIVFSGDEGCETKLDIAPSLTIKGGTFNNFVLKIGEFVGSLFAPKTTEGEEVPGEEGAEAVAAEEEKVQPKKANKVIAISGGIFDSTTVHDNSGHKFVFEDFLVDGYVVVEQNGMFVVMSQTDADKLKAPVVDVIPDDAVVYVPEEVYIPAPAPAPVQTVTVVATEPVAIEVNGAAVELTVAAEDIKAEAVAPVVAGEAAQLKVVLAPQVLAVEGVEAAQVVEAITASVTVEVKGGETVTAEDFQITFNENGELNIELSAEYLEALGKGEHTIILKIGGIEIEFVIVIK